MPVNAVSRRLGISTLTSLRLLTRAPCTRISSWLSAAGAAAFFVLLTRGMMPCHVAGESQCAQAASEGHSSLPFSPVTKLVLIDDHELLRSGMRAVLDQQADMEVVGE